MVIIQNHYDARMVSFQLGLDDGELFDWEELDMFEQWYVYEYSFVMRNFLDNFKFDLVEPINGYRGSIF